MVFARTGSRARPILGMVLLAVAIVALALPAGGVVGGHPSSVRGAQFSPGFTRTGTCYAADGPTPAGVLIGEPAPSIALTSGDRMTVAYELQARNYTSAVLGEVVHVPSLFAKFTLKNHTVMEFFLLHHNLTIAGPNWTDPNLTAYAKTMGGPVVFARNSTATLTSQKLAVMATNLYYGNLTVAMRWQWIINRTANGGNVTVGAWSHLQANSQNPSVFMPAPFVAQVAHSGPTVVIGSTYTALLTGATNGTVFNIELEDKYGIRIRQSDVTTPTVPPNPFNLSIYVMGDNHSLVPEKALVHIHDHCGAILYSTSIVLVYAPMVTVKVGFAPVGCGPLTFNGTAYSGSTNVSMVPSSTVYSASVPSCQGHAFYHWLTHLGVMAFNSSSGNTSVIVSGNGTLAAIFR
ncbi:MAG TPA: hypothetical protein VFF67_02175 [Thermoplasmata archaeon]|nr:hypothetical protein [Thermoplasmata archaeon]